MTWRLSFGTALVAAAIGVAADLSPWVQGLDGSNRLHDVLFRDGYRALPKEAHAGLTKLIQAAPSEPHLYAMRALESERLLDFAVAEKDWLAYARLVQDKAPAQITVADFYYRRLRPQDEIRVLTEAAKAPSPASEQFAGSRTQRSWKLLERIQARIQAHALGADSAARNYQSWIERYPQDPLAYTQYFDFLMAEKRWNEAEGLIAGYRKAFPADSGYPVIARATIEHRRGSLDRAVAVFDGAYDPLWPDPLFQRYFDLLRQTLTLRQFTERARASGGLSGATRLYHYHRLTGNRAGATRSLLEFRMRKESSGQPWTATELWTLGRLFENANDYDEAVRYYYALYSLPAAADADRESALHGIVQLLLTAPERPISFAGGDLSFYRDIATADPNPGFLNGIFSLLFNSTVPQAEFAGEENKSAAYFNRARAAQLTAMFHSRFPNSARRPGLDARLIEAYAAHGEDQAVISAARAFLGAFANAPQRTQVTLVMADAFARSNQTPQEFATYDSLLAQLAAAAGGVPLGTVASPPVGDDAPQRAVAPARSPDYARVLDRYVSRLVALKRVKDALAVYRREVAANPNDPGLYERLAAFLDQNKLAVEIEQVYRQAMAKFQDRSWHHKLARYYLRRKQRAAFDQLTREIAQTFAGTELEQYFREMVGTSAVDPLLYRQVNLYAHQRFPQHLTFVRNLLDAYSRRQTRDDAAYERLARTYWYYDDAIRSRLFELLSRTGRIEGEIRTTSAGNPAATAQPSLLQFVAEGEAWRSHFETAAPALRALAAECPGDARTTRLSAVVHRSLGSFEPARFVVAVDLEQTLGRAAPRDTEVLARIGEIHADRELFESARPHWNRIAEVEPGKPDGFLEAATVFWDYFQYDEALRLIAEARKRFAQPALFAYETGAIHENKREYPAALREYAAGAVAGSLPARSRLIQLSRRPAHAAAVAGLAEKLADFDLRVALFEAHNRRAELEAYLSGLLARASFDEAGAIETVALRHGMNDVRERCLLRQIDLTTDPVDRIRLRIGLARFQESRNNVDAARRTIEALYSEHPAVLGVIRATVDFYWRNKLPEEAIRTLTEGRGRAHASLKPAFTYEAARKATSAGRYEQARAFVSELLTADPFDPRYLTAMAETWSRQGDDGSLRTFYTGKIQEMTAAKVDRSRVAALRRGLVPVLDRLKDYTAACNQYIEILRLFPEDEGLAREAARHAQSNGQRARLAGYFAKATADSPRDPRWHTVLARLHTAFEDFPAAITAYNRGIEVRPDRSDLLEMRTSLEERLLRFDDAAHGYTKLYDLTYKDPKWMLKAAEMRARQGRKAEVLKALEQALVEGQPPSAANFLEGARRLDGWGMPDEALRYAERCPAENWWEDSELIECAASRVHLLARLRRTEQALEWLTQSGASEGALTAALRHIGNAAAIYFSPEERASLVTLIEGSPLTLQHRAALAEAAQLAELEAKVRHEIAMSGGDDDNEDHLRRLIALQNSRLRFSELGGQMEAYWKSRPRAENHDRWLAEAALAYRRSGDAAAELRVLGMLYPRGIADADSAGRYWTLLRQRDPQRLLQLAGRSMDAVKAAIEGDDSALAERAIAARGAAMPLVWTRGYTALSGLHFRRDTPAVRAAFAQCLSGGTIGERIGRPVDRKNQLAGDLWYYYAFRHAEYLSLTRQPVGDIAPAWVEGRPGSADAYIVLADFFREYGDREKAITEYDRALSLNERHAEVHDRTAALLWEMGRRDDASARWRAAIAAFSAGLDQRNLPDSLWSDMGAMFGNLISRGLIEGYRGELGPLLDKYVRRHGNYRLSDLLGSYVSASPAQGVAWIADLSRLAPDAAGFLNPLMAASWIPPAARDPLYQRALEVAEQRRAQSFGDARENADGELRGLKIRWARHLLDTRRTREAQAVLRTFTDEDRQSIPYALTPLEALVAARNGTIGSLVSRWRSNPGEAPDPEQVRDAAATLNRSGERQVASVLLEYYYQRAIDAHDYSPAHFLGLAEIVASRDPAAGVNLLRRMVLLTPAPFGSLRPAASLLDRLNRRAEANQFLDMAVEAAPWDWDARLALAERRKAANETGSIATSTDVPYAVRARAVRLQSSTPDTGSFYGKLDAAEASPSGADRIRLWREAIAAQPSLAPESLRWRLSGEAFRAGDMTLAVSAVELGLEAAGWRSLVRSLEFQPGVEAVERPLAASGETNADRARTAATLAEAMRRLGRLPDARAMFTAAERLAPGTAKAGLDSVTAELNRRAQNAARAPVVTNNLDQPHVVRPRLVTTAQGGAR